MSRDPSRTVFIGNLDEKVTERILYEILIQAGRVLDLHIPIDKETNRHKGYAFAEYETEEIANYAVKLFSGLVSLHNKTLRFSMSGQDRLSQQNGTLSTPKSTDRVYHQGSAELTDFRASAGYSGGLVSPRYHAEKVNVDHYSWSASRRSDNSSPLTPGYSSGVSAQGRFDYRSQHIDSPRVIGDRWDFRDPAHPPYPRR